MINDTEGERAKDAVLLTLDSGGRRRSPAPNLLHERQKISDAPMIGDLSMLHAHDINRLKLNLAVGGSDSEERALVGAVIRLVGRDAIAIRELQVDLGVEIREGLSRVQVELSHACFVWAGSRLCGVIHEIVCKEFLKYVKVPFALNFLRIPAHDRLCRCRYCILVHS